MTMMDITYILYILYLTFGLLYCDQSLLTLFGVYWARKFEIYICELNIQIY